MYGWTSKMQRNQGRTNTPEDYPTTETWQVRKTRRQLYICCTTDINATDAHQSSCVSYLPCFHTRVGMSSRVYIPALFLYFFKYIYIPIAVPYSRKFYPQQYILYEAKLVGVLHQYTSQDRAQEKFGVVLPRL